MIKRSFFALSRPRLTYDLLESDPREPESIPVPGNLTMLIHEEIDSAKQLLFKKGDPVRQGEKIKLYEDSKSYGISPVSGIIQSFDAYADDFGNQATYVMITHDPLASLDPESLDPVENLDFADNFLRTMPGCIPFGTLNREDINVDTLVVNGADTDLLCTANQFIVTRYPDEIKKGASILKAMTGASRLCMIVPEDLSLGDDDFEGFKVFRTSGEYPSALPGLVMKDHLDMVPAPGLTPEEQGICFVKPEALVSLTKVFETGQPVFEKMITLVDKAGTATRVKAVLGTPLNKILTRYGIQVNEQDRIIIGGPMRGFATYTVFHPVTEDMDMVIIQDRDIIPELSDSACVNCGKCVRVCPTNVPVNLLVRFLEAGLYEEAADTFDLESCIECGLCAYVCTARIPLYQYIMLGKHELATLRAES